MIPLNSLNADALFGPGTILPELAYPPTFFLILAPFALLRTLCLRRLGSGDVAWLRGCRLLIVRRRAAIAMALAAPFTAWSFVAA